MLESVDDDNAITVYLDVCCLNRPFDDQTQDRIRLESEAIVLILEHIVRGDWNWLSSEVVIFEIGKNPDQSRRERVIGMTDYVTQSIELTKEDVVRGGVLEGFGFSTYDALHIACAERGNANVFLTTDDGLLRKAKRFVSQLKVHVENPLVWLHEVTL